MIYFFMTVAWALSLRAMASWREGHIDDLRREVSRQSKRAEVAEWQLNGVVDAWAGQLQQNRYRASEVERALRKSQVGGKTEPN